MIGKLLLCIFLFQTVQALHQGRIPPRQKKWLTLNGDQPEVVARGGYSGLFPDSSAAAYQLALDISVPGTILYCNVHFTKDNDAFCVSRIYLQNTTDIAEFDPRGGTAYNIYGREVHGWFGLDYPANIIFENITLKQNIYSRQSVFDGAPIVGPTQLLADRDGKPTRLWLNFEKYSFYNQHKISAEAYLFEQFKVLPEFISSPEIGFLKAIKPKIAKANTKLIFTFLGPNLVEPTTKTTYRALAKNLAKIKSFASGIVVPKDYIWPVNKARVLQPATSLVQDAHKVGLMVFASGFANDNYISYNYSYDPAREYLQFFENSQFCVDGVLTDFPSTASEAMGCLNQDKNAPRVIQALIISHNGASGDFPGASDLAYYKAIEDGADIIDCSVQLSKDGVAFCSDRPDISRTTTAVTHFPDRQKKIREIQRSEGIFSFDLTWSEIQSLKPQMESPFEGVLARNPANMNKGRIVSLTEFLELAKTTAVPGILIYIKNAGYFASMKGIDIVEIVTSELSKAKFDKQSLQKVLIQSNDNLVLHKFKQYSSYQRVLHIEEPISGAPEVVAEEVRQYADAVFVHRDAIVVASQNFVYHFTTTVPALHAANVSVYVGYLRNEFENLIFDYLSDPYVELSTLHSQQIDGIVTDYPATANMFARSSCTNEKSEYVVLPVEPGLLYAAAPVPEPPLLSQEDLIDPTNPIPRATAFS